MCSGLLKSVVDIAAVASGRVADGVADVCALLLVVLVVALGGSGAAGPGGWGGEQPGWERGGHGEWISAAVRLSTAKKPSSQPANQQTSKPASQSAQVRVMAKARNTLRGPRMLRGNWSP